jgi:hypothetical protein
MGGAQLSVSLIIKTISLLGSIAMTIVQLPSQRDSYRVKISGPVTITDGWLELNPGTNLKADRTFQWVVLELKPPFKDDFHDEGKGPNRGKGILLPDGEVINPEIEVIDQFGNKFNLVYAGAEGLNPKYGARYPDKLPRDREYTVVRIRSPKPIECQAVYWHCDSSKDWH